MIRFFLILLPVVLLLSCSGYHRSEFYLLGGESPEKLRFEENYWLEGYNLTDEPEQKFRIPGSGNLLVANVTRVDPDVVDTAIRFMEVNRKLEYRIYSELPPVIEQDSLQLEGNSICYLVGNFNLPERQRVYRCDEGYLLIDSVKGSTIVTHLEGIYFNYGGDSLIFSGKIKAQRR